MNPFEDHVRRMPWTVGETPHDHSALWPPVGEDPKSKAAKMRALKGNRGDKLMGEAAKIKGQLMKWVKEDEKAKAWAAIHALIMTSVCMIFYTIMVVMWFYVYHKSFAWSVVIFVLCLLICPAFPSLPRRSVTRGSGSSSWP